MNKEIKDIDLVIDLPSGGIKFAKWLEENGFTKGSVVTYENFGTAMFHLKEFPDVELEAVQTRSECYHDAKTRNPETSFGTIEQDWQRRDFTINAMYKNVTTMELIDFENRGVQDIKNKVIRTCGEPEIIFDQDPLRILRMIRFASRFNFNIDFDTFQCAKKFVDRLEIISKERITDEFTKMLTFSISSAVKAICLLWDIGAYRFIIPYFDKSNTKEKVDVVNGLTEFNEYYIEWDAPYTIVEDKIIPILANLLYHTYTFVYKEGIKYYLSEVLKYPNDVINKVVFLIEKSYELKNNKDVTSIRRIMNQCGNAETFYLATIIGSNWLRSAYHTKYYDLEPTFFEKMDDKNYMFYGYKLPVTGEDVMEIFNISPSPKIKEILDKTYNHVLHYPEHSDRDNCIEFLKQLKDSDDENVLS
jgi:tRNA nucleotidyltransferase/poly(A) polymerase